MPPPTDTDDVALKSGIRRASPVKGLNVLLVSTDEKTRLGVRNALTRQHVARAGSLSEAIAVVRSFDFDVVISDAEIGDASIVDLQHVLRGMERFIVLTNGRESKAVRDFLSRSDAVVLKTPCEAVSVRVAVQVIAARTRIAAQA